MCYRDQMQNFLIPLNEFSKKQKFKTFEILNCYYLELQIVKAMVTDEYGTFLSLQPFECNKAPISVFKI